MITEQQQTRHEAIQSLGEKLKNNGGKYEFPVNAMPQVQVRQDKCQATLNVSEVYEDEKGWKRIVGTTPEFCFAIITVFSDAISTEDLNKIANAIK